MPQSYLMGRQLSSTNHSLLPSTGDVRWEGLQPSTHIHTHTPALFLFSSSYRRSETLQCTYMLVINGNYLIVVLHGYLSGHSFPLFQYFQYFTSSIISSIISSILLSFCENTTLDKLIYHEQRELHLSYDPKTFVVMQERINGNVYQF